MSESVQVFCDICSRGVLVYKESMYKCKKCGKQVCGKCFDVEFKQCYECAQPIRIKREKERREGVCPDCKYFPPSARLDDCQFYRFHVTFRHFKACEHFQHKNWKV